MNQRAQPMLRVALKRLHREAKIPAYQTPGAAGFDIHAIVDNSGSLDIAQRLGGTCAVQIAPGETHRVSTGIAVSIGDPGWALYLLPRSGLGAKGIVLANSVGLIDSDYQGELIVLLKNTSKEPFMLQHGDRIAQGVFGPVMQAAFHEVEDFAEQTERGERGFGSTGVGS